MMFDLAERRTHWIPVKWPSLLPPTEEGGLSVPGEHEVELNVELVDRDEMKRLFPAIYGEAEDSGPQNIDEEFALFKRLVLDWRKVNDKGRRAEMTDDNVRALLRTPMFGPAFTQAYLIAMGGVIEIRAKNSDASPPNGREAEPESAKANS